MGFCLFRRVKAVFIVRVEVCSIHNLRDDRVVHGDHSIDESSKHRVASEIHIDLW